MTESKAREFLLKKKEHSTIDSDYNAIEAHPESECDPKDIEAEKILKYIRVIEKSYADKLQAELSSARSHAEVMDHKASRLNEIARKQDKLLRECEKAIRHMHYCKYWLNKSHEDCDCNMHLIVEKLRERKK